MRRAAALMMAMILIACCTSCAIELEDAPPPSPAPIPVAQQVDMTPRIEIEAALYFLNRTRSKLEAETRTISVEQNACPELAIVHALIDGPAAEGLYPVASGLAAERVEVMPDLINVYLRRTGTTTSPWNLAVTKMALAASLIDYTGVRYVNMLVDGQEPGYTTAAETSAVPAGAAVRPGDLGDEISALMQKAVSASYDAYLALYFLDLSERWLLPEVTRITVSEERDTVRQVVELLIEGPGNGYSLRRSLDSGLELIEHSFAVNEAGQRVLRLVFNRLPTVYTTNFVDGEQMAAAALTYTLTDFIPDIAGIELTDRANPTRTAAYAPSDFAEMIGNRIIVFLPNTPGGATMTGVERVVAQAQSNDLYVLLEMLMRGPMTTDSRSVWPAAPDGITSRSVLDTYRAGDVIVINLDGAAAEILEAAGTDDERVFLFSVINTMTNLKGVRCVLFLREGERTEYFGRGAVCVLDPIMKNPGIIR